MKIFLDFVTANQFTDTAHVMESRFDAVLSESDKIFRDKLKDFVDQLPDEAKQSSVYPSPPLPPSVPSLLLSPSSFPTPSQNYSGIN